MWLPERCHNVIRNSASDSCCWSIGSFWWNIHKVDRTSLPCDKKTAPGAKDQRPTKQCRVCSARHIKTIKGKPTKTIYICKTCPSQPGLHINKCFEIYHTELDIAQTNDEDLWKHLNNFTFLTGQVTCDYLPHLYEFSQCMYPNPLIFKHDTKLVIFFEKFMNFIIMEIVDYCCHFWWRMADTWSECYSYVSFLLTVVCLMIWEN